MSSSPARRAFAAGIGVAALTATLVAGAASAGAAPKKPTPAGPPSVDLQLLALNDFHGQLEPPSATSSSSRLPGQTGAFGGAEFLATQVRQLEADSKKQNTLTVAAGDLIGATPLLSAAFHDEPAIEALNRIGLDYASVGNHEFDEGPAELLRIQNGGCHPEDGCADPARPFEGADFQYLSANAFSETGGVDDTLLPPYAIHKVQGIKVGFIGMTLEGTPSVVTPSGIEGLDFGDEAVTANRYAAELQAQGVEAIVVLVHEGGRQTAPSDVDGCNVMTGAITEIVPRMDDSIDAVITGHTHDAYNCREVNGTFVPAASTTEGRLVTSSSSVGRLVTDIDLTLDRRTGDVLTATSDNVPVSQTLPKDAAQTALIAYYRALLGPIAAEVVGYADAGLTRTAESVTYRNTATTNRTLPAESPLGNFIADGQLAATPTSVVAFMNPGGVRADVVAGEVTYEEAFSVQPFGNYLSQITLTGAQLQCVLEQQFVAGNVLQPAGITYEVSSSGVAGTVADPCSGTVVRDNSVEIDGVPIPADGSGSYRITVNNFLADGGDGFTQFRLGSARQDVLSPEDDLAALIQYLDGTTATAPATAPATDRIAVTG